VVSVWIISQRRAFYADRYLSFTIPALLLLLALGAVRIKSLPWRGLLIAGLIVASGYGLLNTRFDPAFFKDDWRGVTTFLTQNQQPDDVILLYNSHLGIPFSYYYRGNSAWKPITHVLESYPIEPLTVGHRRAWVLYHYGRRPTHYPMQPLRPNGGWGQDADRNPLLVAWFDDHVDKVLDYRHFRGLELWLVDLEKLPTASEK
jgi:hypothetical protein